MIKYFLIFANLLAFTTLSAQNWIDSLDNYARERISPPQIYALGWQNAPLLHAMELQYEMMPESERQKYFDYVKRAMDRNLWLINGFFPNSTSSGNGVAFLYRVTGDPLYLEVANRIYNQYSSIIRTSNGGVSHLAYAPELWDDTVYMIGVFLLSMYRATNDENYILELIEQIRKHQEKLEVEEWGLWVHGWDDNNVYNVDFCSQSDWADPITRRSAEIWGRGNGWVVLTLSEILNNITPAHPEWDYVSTTLRDMIIHLPELQDETTGHWYQLPVRKGEAGNYIESSCTAMFGYGILTALKYEIVSGEAFENAVENAYYGLKNNSIAFVGNNDKPYLNTKNVALETCLGDKNYYFDISTGGGKAYASAVYIIFGRAYDKMYLNDEVTSIFDLPNNSYHIRVSPTVVKNTTNLTIQIQAAQTETVQYQLVDMMGRTVQQQSQFLMIGENRNTFLISTLQSGQYFFIVRSKEGQLLKSDPIIIQ